MTVSSRADARGAHVEASRHTSDGVEPLVWINGERRPGGGAHVSAYDRGVTLADGVFETMTLDEVAPLLMLPVGLALRTAA